MPKSIDSYKIDVKILDKEFKCPLSISQNEKFGNSEE